MTKAYLAGFIAGTLGKTWDDNPFVGENGEGNYTSVAVEWRTGCSDGRTIADGDYYTGMELVK